MSESLRTLASADFSTRRYRAKPRRRRGGKLLLLVGALLVAGYGLWLTRDNYPMEQLIPANQAYQILANDILGKRATIAQSKIWKAVPESLGVSAIPKLLGQSPGVPEWVLRNFIPDICHVSGNDLKGFSDVLAITRMTRTGCLLEKCRVFVPGIRRDYAGGLNLRYVPLRAGDPGVFYAVRGRLLAVSRSRDALIRSLTLSPEEALAAGSLANMLAESKTDDLRGAVTLSPDEPLGDIFTNIRFAVRVDSAEADVNIYGSLRPEWQSRGKDLLANLVPRKLRGAPRGAGSYGDAPPLEISMDLGKPVRELATALGRATNLPDQISGLWANESGPATGKAGDLARGAVAFLGPLGPGIRLTWCGVDFNEMIPMPEIVFTFDANQETLANVFDAIPPAPENAQPYDMYARYDPETKRAHIPLIGGPSIEPTAGVYGDTVLLSSSRTVAETLLKKGPAAEEIPQPGNLFIRVRTKPCAEALVNLGALLAEYGLLKNYSKEQYDQATAPWVSGAAIIEDITVLAAYENGEIRAELKIRCAPNPGAG